MPLPNDTVFCRHCTVQHNLVHTVPHKCRPRKEVTGHSKILWRKILGIGNFGDIHGKRLNLRCRREDLQVYNRVVLRTSRLWGGRRKDRSPEIVYRITVQYTTESTDYLLVKAIDLSV